MCAIQFVSGAVFSTLMVCLLIMNSGISGVFLGWIGRPDQMISTTGQEPASAWLLLFCLTLEFIINGQIMRGIVESMARCFIPCSMCSLWCNVCCLTCAYCQLQIFSLILTCNRGL